MRNLRNVRALTLAVLFAIVFDAVVFWLPVYRTLLAPDSSTGAFERTLAAADRDARDPRHDVLVFGDSRIYDGLIAPVADRYGHGLHFINAAIPGTTPRVWSVFARAIDPTSTRFRAVVIPVDTYADDDGAIGSADRDDHFSDLRYVALSATPSESADIVHSIGPIDEKFEGAVDLALRAPLLRDDVQAFARDPTARLAALRDPLPDLDASHASPSSLAGLNVNFTTKALALPHAVSGEQLEHLHKQLFHVAGLSVPYRYYRAHWWSSLIVRCYLHHVPVVFVRIPARPLHATLPPPPTGFLLKLAQYVGVKLVPQEPYVALERPALFSDAEHLDRAGALLFSKRFGADIARAIDDPKFGFYARPHPTQTQTQTQATAAPANARFAFPSLLALPPTATPAFGVAIPLVSYEFAFFVAAIAALVLLLPNEPSRRALLLLASWYFYARWNAAYLAILVALTTLDYAIARRLERASGMRKRIVLGLGVCANLAFLGFAKYADLASGTVAQLLGRANDPWALHLLVPVGISFHTFQSISYVVDVARGKTRAERNYLNYALYIAFFPQLLAGPIVRANRFFGELYARKAPTLEHAARGLGEIALGVLKKSAIADRFAPIVDAYWAPGHPGGAPAAWCAALAFAMQIYFDFSGYTDIAIGCARLLGFDFPQNFHRPYLAWSVTEFWRRWHMTLSAWLRDYLYIPLGGNRHGNVATYRNLIVTMLLGGLWHGANWTFVIWGGYHGALLALERVFGAGRDRAAPAPRGPARIACTGLTFVLVLVGWIVFRAPTPGAALAGIGALAFGGAGPLTLDAGDFAIIAIALGVETVLEARLLAGRRRFAFAVATLLALQLGTYPGTTAPFVYFKF